MNEEIKTNLSEEEFREMLREKLLKKCYQLSRFEKQLLKQFTSFLPDDTRQLERRFYFLHNLTEMQLCPVCGKKAKFDDFKKNIAVFCSKECMLSKEGKEIKYGKLKDTWKKKFPKEEKTKRITNFENMTNEDIIRYLKELFKIYLRCWNRILSSEEIKAIYKVTAFLPKEADISERRAYILNNLHDVKICPVCGKRVKHIGGKFAVFCSMKCSMSEKGKEIVCPKIKQVWKNRDLAKRNSIIEKQRTSCKELYGNECYLQSDIGKAKSKKTLFEHYKVAYSYHCKELLDKSRITRRKNNYDTFLAKCSKKRLLPLFTKDEYINAVHRDKLRFKCLRCQQEFEYVITKGNIISILAIRCTNEIHSRSSLEENEVAEWIRSLFLNSVRNKRKWGKKVYTEADIFLPDYNLAIEFNGIYWHSSKIVKKYYHFNKWKTFKDMNIDCIQILETEWLYKKDIVKDTILKRLNNVDVRINDNDCLLKELNEEEYKLFVEQNYIKEYEEAEVKIGLFYNNELVQCLGVKKDKNEWMIVCVCSKLNCIVENGLNKLLNYFKEYWKGNIIVYVDNRYFNGKDYIENGFKYKKHTEPKCLYFKAIKNKFYCFKIPESDSVNKYIKLFDCGYDVYNLKNI